jgi:hypothetical protein
MTLPPWTYMIFEPNENAAKVSVRLLAADLPSQGEGSESIEALVEVLWRDDLDEQTIRRDALLRLQRLVDAELKRLEE